MTGSDNPRRDGVDWAAVRALFDRVADLPPAAREAALDDPSVDVAVRAEVRSLLAAAADAEGGDFLASPAAPPSNDEIVDRMGQRLGAWRLARLLGRGGMGEVWLAHRDDGAFDGDAAVKVLRRGMDSGRILARFALEQRALARLNHPNIAHLIDAGRTADGLPYFVMERIEGVPVTQACEGRSVDERLALFLQLADAVAHAHRQLLVHRDLKPNNVLVTADGRVKLLDFGIAKAIDPFEHADGEATIAGERPFTPQYASPEQVRGEPVGTATDIYSLGVLLYQMLTGLRPTGRDAGSALDAARSVLEETPTRPSALSPGLVADPRWMATRRRLEGDLDNILLKALDKRAEQRYPSVDAFAADIRAHLAGFPVSARAPSLAYVVGRFVQRHRATVAAGALGLAGLVVGLAASLWQAHEAALARDAARQRLAETRGIARDIVMRYGDAVTYLPGGMKLKLDLLTDTVAHLDRLAADAVGDAAFAGDLAMAYARLADITAQNFGANLDRAADAARHTERALALFELGAAAHDRDETFAMWWGRAMRAQANNLRQRGDAEGSLRWRLRQRDMLRAAIDRGLRGADLRSELGSALIGIGQAYDTAEAASLGQAAPAMKAFDEADALFAALAAEDPKDYTYPYQRGTVAGARELVLVMAGRAADAVPHGERAVALRRQALALEPANVALREGLATEESNLASVLLDAGLPAQALPHAQQAVAIIEELARDEPASDAWPQRRRTFQLHRGRALLGAGRAGEAVADLRDAVAQMAGARSGSMLRRRALGEIALAEALHRTRHSADADAAAGSARRDLELFLAENPGDATALALRARLAAVFSAR